MTRGDGLTDADFAALAQHLDDLVREFEALPFPQVRERVFELLQAVDALHRTALSRLLDILHTEDGGAVVARAAEDPVVRALMMLYGFLPSDVEETPPSSGGGGSSFIPLSQIGRPPSRGQPPAFTEVARLEEVPPGTTKEVEVAGIRVLLANVAGEISAVSGTCPGSVAPLSLGAFTPPIVICPWHNEAFDVRTGKRVDGMTKPVLDVFLTAIKDGLISLAPQAASPHGALNHVP